MLKSPDCFCLLAIQLLPSLHNIQSSIPQIYYNLQARLSADLPLKNDHKINGKKYQSESDSYSKSLLIPESLLKFRDELMAIILDFFLPQISQYFRGNISKRRNIQSI